MSVMRSYGKGIQDALLRPKAAFLFWAVNALFAVFVYTQMAGALSKILARSLAGEALMTGSAVETLTEILTAPGAPLAGWVRMAVVLFILYAFVAPLLYGGVLNDLVRPREVIGFAASFWAGGGKYYGRFFRLQILSILLWIPSAAVFYAADKIFAAAAPDPGAEQVRFYLILARILFALFLFFIMKMTIDYARIRMAVTESHGTLGALLWAVIFVTRKLLKSLLLYYFLGITALAGMAITLGLHAIVAETTTAGVLLSLFLTQLHIFWRSFIKVAYQGAQIRFYLLETA